MATYKKVSVAELINDDRYQRPIDEKRVAKIATDFNPRLLGVLEISKRNGKSAVIDGQHRLAAIDLLGMDKVACMVHTDLSPQDEAVLFVELQSKRKTINAVDRFRALVFAGDETAVTINDIVESAGWVVGDTIRAVVSLQNIYKRGGASLLDETLGFAASTWAGDDKTTDGYFLEGVSEIIAGYGGRLGAEETTKLAALSPSVYLRRAMGQMAGGGSHARRHAVAAALRKVAGVRGRPTVRKTAKAPA